ncbi:MAG: hypothetical protein FWG79_04935 [Bacteroidales bacterium]|nr:hypothetical protein [Bacteroidales bacterium]
MKTTHIILTVALMIAAMGCGGSKTTDGVYIGQPVSELISIFEKQYEVVRGVISLEGDDYPAYDVFENDELLFQVELHPDRLETAHRIWIYSPQIKTQKGIGVGSTYGELKSKYNIAWVSEEGGLNVWVEGLSALFRMTGEFPEDFDWSRLDKESMPESLTIQEIMLAGDDIAITPDKRIIAQKARKAREVTTTTVIANNPITMTTNAREVKIYIEGKGTATVDWGDGSQQTTASIENPDPGDPFDGALFTHRFSNTKSKVITITGDDILIFRCEESQLTALDVSQHTTLAHLFVGGNRLTALDVSKNTALIELFVGNNQFTADGLNALFSTLPNKGGTVVILDNPGSADCDPSIAEAKGWTVVGFEGNKGSASTDTDYAIRLVVKAALSQFSSYHGTLDEDSEFGASVIIARTTVRDFIFFELSHENRAEPQKPVNLEQNTIFKLNELTPEKPFVTNLLEGWQRGFSYVDENNVRRFFSIEFDDDGVAYLLEFKARGR